MKNKTAQMFMGLSRIGLGLVFLWAFLDKTFGLGFATVAGKNWLAGGSPTMGFLKMGTSGPMASFYQGLAGQIWVDVLFMVGLLGIGLALTLGIGMKIATYSGTLMMALMYTAAMPPKNNPLVDDHVIYALVLMMMAFADAGDYMGLGLWWKKQKFVKQNPILV